MNKVKLMIKVLIYINVLFFITIYLAPSTKVFANFTDSATLNAGIKLSLGNLDLSPEQDETITGLTYLGGDPVLLSTHYLKNEGTLNGKLAYKIQVNKKGTNIQVDNDETQLIMNFGSEIGEKVIPISQINSGSYAFVTDNEDEEWIFDGNSETDIPITIKYKNSTIPVSDQDIDIIVTFLLVQTNVSEPKETMFYDKVSFKHELKLKAAEISNPTNPDYWPAADDKNWKWNGEVRYYDAYFENIMYFSEIENSDRVGNLNDNVLYIELPEDKLKKNKDFEITQKEGSNVEIEVMENKRFIKITYSFNKSTVEAKNLLSQPGYPSVAFTYGEHKSYTRFGGDLLPLIYKRVLLSSDKNSPGVFETLPIYTTLMQQKIYFKKISENYTVDENSYINQTLSDAKLNYKKLETIVSENSKLFDVSLQKANNEDYLLVNTNSSITAGNENNKGKLKIILIGNNGNRLVIYRDLYTTNETKAAVQSQITNQEDASSVIEATESEVLEVPLETPVEATESDEQTESIQGSLSEEIITSDSSVEIPEESVQEDSENDSSLKNNEQQKDEATKNDSKE
ncbi:MAG: hypothetical protein PWR19_2072 [Carnobacterium sp.]|uniref:hypothetical protein n=1 Tax=Carnobacterium sp. TaxID=48221 RepID=UPI0026485CF4|nr:hypothetical protein [Carnobacterium sp.]MDN5373026.1 hypothetical protein [Carnobacterium sp.]